MKGQISTIDPSNFFGKGMNWTGGFIDPMATLDFMSAGGIPTTARPSP